MNTNFYKTFPKKKLLLGMIHLFGNDIFEKVQRALEEIKIYENEGLDGAIIEDYYGEIGDVNVTLNELNKINPKLIIGVNILKAPYSSFEFANKYNASFVQFDTIQASPNKTKNYKKFNEELFMILRKKYPHLVVLGGVRFKYIPPTGRTLDEDIIDGIGKCDAIVTTGEGTGIETPTQKLRDFREKMGAFPLIVGAGISDKNMQEQMEIADGAIVGSYFKDYNTREKVKPERVRKLVNLI